MNQDDRIDERQEERRDDEPGEAIVEAEERGPESLPAYADTVHDPDTRPEGQSEPVAPTPEEVSPLEEPSESLPTASVPQRAERRLDEPADDAGPVDYATEATRPFAESAEAPPPEEPAPSAESPTDEVYGRGTAAEDADLPGMPPAGDTSSPTEGDSHEPRFSDIQRTAAAQEEDERFRPKVVISAGTDERSLRAVEICREKARQLHLRMHPIGARYNGEKNITIFFRADDKVNFRKLVRELSTSLHARIEMRQLGPREQGKLCGLVGKCGYPLCCRTFLPQFTQSSIKMAKTQDLALNPLKISGVCGRLLCCLNYEQEHYAEVKSRMPKVNKQVDTEFGPGRVASLNVLKETVTVQFETMTRELPLDAVHRVESQG